MEKKIIHIDSLTEICGHFYMDEENWCNNGYNCSHEDCGDKIFFDKKGNSVNLDKMIRGHYRKFNLKKKRLLKKKTKEYKQKRNDIDFWVKKFKLHYVGKCFSFSCPMAYRADLEDMKELDEELAKQFDDDISAMDADYMIVDEKLINSNYYGRNA